MTGEAIWHQIARSNLPDLPETLQEIFHLLQNPIGVDILFLIEKIRTYGNLEELLLRKINSSYFEQDKKVNTLQQAILYLGLQTIQNLLLYFMIRSLFSSHQSEIKEYSGARYWKHCLGTSIAAKMLAEKVGSSDPYMMFSYGLIHDIGVVILEFALPEALGEINRIQQSHVSQIIAERKVLDGLTHEDLGIWLCKKWRLPQAIQNIVGFHHRPFLAFEQKEEVKLFHTADVISTMYYEGLIGIHNTESVNKNISSSLLVEPNLVKEIRNKLPEEVEKVKDIFS